MTCHMAKNAKRPVRRSAASVATQRYRARLQAQGLRAVQIWVPDTRSPKFAAECRRQSQIIARNLRHDGEVMDWIEAARDTSNWK